MCVGRYIRCRGALITASSLMQKPYVSAFLLAGALMGRASPGGRSRNRDSRARRQSVHSACTHYALFLYTIRGAEPKMGAGIHWYQSTTRTDLPGGAKE